jgi:long-chain acyl-CoA synthetase
MFVLMLQVPKTERPRLHKLRIAVSGGAPLSPEVWKAFEKTFHAKMVEGYGLTEASPVVAVNPPFGLHKHGSVGLPIPGVEVKVVGTEGREVRAGEVGELAVRGGNVMKGYLNRPQDTREVLRDGWLYTGDLARLDEDGYLYIAGRKKELIIVGGLNVYPGEVERVLVEHPAVLEAAAFGVDDPARGEAVWAAVVLCPDHSASDRDLRAFCREKLATYKVPRGVEIRSELPKNALGKVMRHVLREEVTSQAAECAGSGAKVTESASRA